MEVMIGVLSFTVATLAVLQGWQMVKKRNNPNDLSSKLDTIINQLGRMEQRLNDIWDKLGSKGQSQ